MSKNSVLKGNNLHIARHVETSKNILDIHGVSNECRPTKLTEKQLYLLSKYIGENDIKQIITASTAQCLYTSSALKSMLSIDVVELGLSPIDLGMYAGLSHEAFREKNRRLAYSMELFRYRVLPYNKTSLVELSDPTVMSKEICNWWSTMGNQFANDSIFILSNSLIVKLANMSHGILPVDDNYFNIGFTNGAATPIDEINIDRVQWPEVNHRKVKTAYGEVIIAEFEPKISLFEKITLVIYPGIFGCARFGPYNLFNRMARKFAEHGIRSALFDPIGSGEALPFFRSIETEFESLNSVVNYYKGSGRLSLCAHSLSANILYKYISEPSMHKYLIAPILDIDSRKAAWNVEGKKMKKHGIEFSSDFWDDKSLASFKDDDSIDFYFGTSDQYVDHRMIKDMVKVKKENIHLITGAGHNFSEGDTSNMLINMILEDILKLAYQ